jgi:hypothetical protein
MPLFCSLKEYFTLTKLICTFGCYLPVVYVTEESAAFFQSATDQQHWGMDCSKLMEAVSVHAFDRHFQIARTTSFRNDVTATIPIEWFVAEKTGKVQHCIDINDRKYQTMESYMRASPSPGMDVWLFLFCRSSFVGVEAYHRHLQPRQNILRLLEYAGINNTQQAEEGYRSSAEWAFPRSQSSSSADGLSHNNLEHVAMIRALLSFAVDARNVDLSWLDDLPPADATTLHDLTTSTFTPTNLRVLVAEVFEQQGRHADAIRFVQTDLQDYHNLNVSSKVRAGRVLGRCHAALGQHMLSVSAFDAAIKLAQSRKLLLSEALSVRGRAAAGVSGGGGGGLHWDGETRNQRLAEVMGRMQGPREVLGMLMLLSQ